MKACYKDGKCYLNGVEMEESKIWRILRELKAYQIRNGIDDD